MQHSFTTNKYTSPIPAVREPTDLYQENYSRHEMNFAVMK